MFCPDTESGKCIGAECIAYNDCSRPSLCKCKTCGEEFHLGGSCSQDGHTRNPEIIKNYPRCEKYKVDL